MLLYRQIRWEIVACHCIIILTFSTNIMLAVSWGYHHRQDLRELGVLKSALGTNLVANVVLSKQSADGGL